MEQQNEDYIVVIHGENTDPSIIIATLETLKAVALNVSTFSDWRNSGITSEHNLLCIRDNGEVLYARDNQQKEEIKGE